MHRFKYLVFLVPFLFIVQPSFADDRAKVVGLWKVISFETEFQATSEREPVLGKNPMGYVMFTPEGRIWSIVTGEKREAPKTDQDRAALFKNMFAYTGMYRVEGDKLITKVDVSWNPAWLGTEQVRFFKIDGDRIQHFSPWIPAVTKPERGMARGITTLERVKTGDPLTGVWELNLAKSKFTNIPAPKSEIRTYEVTGQREIMTSERIDAKGQLVISEFLATRDGQDVPQTGRSLYDSISVSPIDALTAYYTHKKAGKMVGDGTRVISKDGKTMTITFKGTGPKGQPVGATFVYDKR
jgi:hypothetical protein